MKFVTIWCRNKGIAVREEVAEYHGVQNGQEVKSNSKFLEILSDNIGISNLEKQAKSILNDKRK